MSKAIARTVVNIVFFAAIVKGPAVHAQTAWPAVDSITRPWTRWWWMGSAVDSQDLRLNMQRYRAAGLGGLELTPIYGVRGYENEWIDYLSPKWMDMFGYTLQEARRLGLGLDLSNGTGWPFGGGPLIDSAYACKELFFRQWAISAGSDFQDTIQFIQTPLVHTDGRVKPAIGDLVQPVFANRDRQALALDQVRFPNPLHLEALMAYREKAALDVTDKVDAKGWLHWTPPSGGVWTLYGVFSGAHGKMVERAAPGAEGNVIDHFSVKALAKYLSRFDTAFAGRSLQGLRAFFNDSYEVDDSRGQSNWTPGFFEIFKERRGYDLRPFLPVLLNGGRSDSSRRILSDYRQTISDLLLSQFTQPWSVWAHAKRAVIRNQAHGSPANILDLYAASDIPETEGDDLLRFKFASSAGNVTGKQLVSAEAVTWQNEHFLTSLGDVRKSVDKLFLGGVNHIFYHGTAYSPDKDPWPGWLFYAAVHFTQNDPSWQYFHVLNEYVSRCQSFLQKGRPDNDVLLYYPQYDSWAERGTDLLKHYDRMEPEFSGTGFRACADSMVRGGYGFDYISDEQLQSAQCLKGGITSTVGTIHTHDFLGAEYKTIVLPDCRIISRAAFAHLIEMAKAGATIIVYGSLPSDVPGWNDWQTRLDALQKMLSGLNFHDAGGFKEATVGAGRFLSGGNLFLMLDATEVRRERAATKGLSLVRRRFEDGNLYFIVNNSGRVWDGPVALNAFFRSAVLFDAMTGAAGLAKIVDGRLWLQLQPGESRLVRTYYHASTGVEYPYYTATGDQTPVTGKWTIYFVDGGPALPAAGTMTSLQSWTTLNDEAARFCGTARYTINFRRPASIHPGRSATTIAAWRLDLGRVGVTAEVRLNGQELGSLIGPVYQLTLPAKLMRDNNSLEIRVSNLMANRIIDMDKRNVQWKKFYNTNFPAHDKANRGADGLFDASNWTPLASGLLGPVTLIPLKTAEEKDLLTPTRQSVLEAMRTANDYFMSKWTDPGKEIVTNIARPSHIWTRSVYYEGLMALYGIDPQQRYYDYAVDWGAKHQWTPRRGLGDRNADDQCCGQTYIDLYLLDRLPERITAIKTCIDSMVLSGKRDDWNWIDALQMSMPVFARLGVLYKDTAYFRKMYDLYATTKNDHGGKGLYNKADHLWWRDKDFVPPYQEPNGADCYWSRGNGWVLAALTRVLMALPADAPHRKEYLQDYTDMVHALVPLQRPDGFWNVSLHDSTHFGGMELSGTALFTYGIAWGIRQGILDRATYLPTVQRAWMAMVENALHPDGMLGFVQGTGKEPKDGQPVSYDKIPDFEDYGLGCFLLAGSEIWRLAGVSGQKKL